jgi:hypothetical protein
MVSVVLRIKLPMLVKMTKRRQPLQPTFEEGVEHTLQKKWSISNL